MGKLNVKYQRIQGRFFLFFFFTERKEKGLANLVCTVCVA